LSWGRDLSRRGNGLRTAPSSNGAGGRAYRRALVTGCAGFLGSHLSERLIDQGLEVVGVDCFTHYYPPELKRRNLMRLLDEPGFELLMLDLSRDPVTGLLEDVDVVFHLAAQPGVRQSFGVTFDHYLRNNILATQRLLEEAARRPTRAFVYASSSSVYGDAPVFPTPETAERRPVSPYGVTKLAVEELARVYHLEAGLHTIGLRYFTAYGPRQRPDMALMRFIDSAVSGKPVFLLGDGMQRRDFTYVDDVVSGTVAAAERGAGGAVYNVGTGRPVELRSVIRLLEDLVGHPLVMERGSRAPGDASFTGADPSLAERDFGFVANTDLRTGLQHQLEWVIEGVRQPARLGVD
jgi:nucleoside-diphosphate-sugar epimerase